jgi:hypothetical protein
MDHVFKGFGFGAALGVDPAATSEESDVRRGVLSFDGKDVHYTLYFWKSPDGSELLVSLNFRCPQCDFPMHVKATQAGISLVDDVLTMRTAVACGAHWEAVNRNGQLLGQRHKCGWTGVVRDDEVHSTRCQKANFNYPASNLNCSCEQVKFGAGQQ